MSQSGQLQDLDCHKLAQEAASNSHVSYSTSVRPTKSRTVYRGGIAYLCLGIIGLGYGLLLFEFPPVWKFTYIELVHAIFYCFAGMLLIVCSSNFDKRKYVITGLLLGCVTSITCALGAVVAAVGAGYSQTHCECTAVMHGTKSGELLVDHNCTLCGTTSHLLLYLAIMIHCCIQFAAALWVSIHSGRLLHYTNNRYTPQFPVP